MPDDDTTYQATDASRLVGEIFGSGLSIADAIEKLRARLLDLTTRNRLLSYRFPKGRCIPIVGTPNYNQVFEKLTDGGSIRLLPVWQGTRNGIEGYPKQGEDRTGRKTGPEGQAGSFPWGRWARRSR